MAEGRLFIGNVSPEATEDEFKSHLSNYGTVKKVEIKYKKDIDGKVLSTFAFVDMVASRSELEECIEKCSGSSWWSGYRVKLQIAKESFMSRLAKERESTNKKPEPVIEARSHKGAPYKRIVIEEEETDFGDKVPDGTSIGGIIQFDDTNEMNRQHSGIRKPVRKYYSSSSDEDDDQAEGVRSKPKMPKYSGGAFMRKLESFNSDFWKEEDEKKTKSSTKRENDANLEPISRKKGFLSSQDNRSQSLNPNLEPLPSGRVEKNLGKANREQTFESSNPNLVPLGTKEKTNSDDIKRVTSLKERQVAMKRQKDFISLSLTGQNSNKIRRYEDSDNEEPAKKSKLFDDSDDEGQNDNDRFKERPEFEGPSGHHLLGLQSNFGSDDRFKMDHRFADSSGIKAKLKKQPKDKSFKDSTKLRFDPSNVQNVPSELTEDYSDEEAQEKTEDTNENLESFDKDKLEDRFYEVSKDLKSAFASKKESESSSSFSLLKAFGQHSGPDVNQAKDFTAYETTKIKSDKKKDLFTANPFKYDSSDDENEESNNKEDSMPLPTKKPTFQSLLRSSDSIVSEKFFFSENDERFSEGIHFLTSIAEDLQEIRTKYEDERPVLASIIRKKHRNKAKALEQRSRGFGVDAGNKKGKKKGLKIRKKSWNKK